MNSRPGLISAAELADSLKDGGLIIVDCRFNLKAPEAGREAFNSGHIPGAVYAHLDEDLAGPVSGSGGRHPLPDPQHFEALLQRWGLSAGGEVVVYDDMSGAIAARLWWLLRWSGHEAVRLLDGGLKAWLSAGYELTKNHVTGSGGDFVVKPGCLPSIDADELASGLASDELLLLDARAPERFRGEVEPIDAIAGHIPGALNLPFEALLDETGCFRSSESLQAIFTTACGPVDAELVAASCGSGVTACHLLLGMYVAGLGTGKLYAGSWSDWISDPDRAIAVRDT